jgi:lipopolysaccharide transport system permease protein
MPAQRVADSISKDWRAIAMIRSLYSYRRFIARSAWNEMRDRYAGSGLGVFWNILVPLIQISIYVFVFSAIMGARVAANGQAAPPRFAFVLFLCAGMLPWLAFADSVSRGTQALVRNASYLQKMALPEVIFVAQSSVVGFLTAAISLVLFFVAGIPMGLPVGWSYLLVPIVLLLFQLLGFGFSLLLSSLNVLFRDIGQAMILLLPMWMWLTPIVYAETILPPVARTLIHWNPAYGFITAFRDIFLKNQAPALATWGMMVGWAVASILLGYLVLAKLRVEIRDVL